MASNTLKNFITNLGRNLSNNIEKLTLAYKEDIFSVSFNHAFNETINESDGLIVLTNLKDETAAGLGGISVKINKHVANQTIRPVTHIYNLSIKNSIYPENLKWLLLNLCSKMGLKHL